MLTTLNITNDTGTGTVRRKTVLNSETLTVFKTSVQTNVVKTCAEQIVTRRRLSSSMSQWIK